MLPQAENQGDSPLPKDESPQEQPIRPPYFGPLAGAAAPAGSQDPPRLGDRLVSHSKPLLDALKAAPMVLIDEEKSSSPPANAIAGEPHMIVSSPPPPPSSISLAEWKEQKRKERDAMEKANAAAASPAVDGPPAEAESVVDGAPRDAYFSGTIRGSDGKVEDVRFHPAGGVLPKAPVECEPPKKKLFCREITHRVGYQPTNNPWPWSQSFGHGIPLPQGDEILHASRYQDDTDEAVWVIPNHLMAPRLGDSCSPVILCPGESFTDVFGWTYTVRRIHP